MGTPLRAASPRGPPTGTSLLAKPHRKQVTRACEWCRARRIKCDNGSPCRNCRVRGVDCTNTGSNNVLTLPRALEEISRLKRQVEGLQAKIEVARGGGQHSSRGDASTSPVLRTLPITSTDLQTGPRADPTPPGQNLHTNSPLLQWEGVYAANARSDRTSYYGPSSTFYFASRIGAYLTTALPHTYIDQSMQPHGVNKTLASPSSTEGTEYTSIGISRGGAPRKINLPRSQEEHFLSLFWESYHCVMPIIDEGDFHQHYASLWETSRPQRKDSALVDIIIALSMQYGFAFIPRDTLGKVGHDGRYEDSTIAGRWYYRRCQSLLALEMESPSITTLQCHIYSSIYLCCASFQNMAHTTLSLAVRTAQILGLHLDPPQSMSRGESELRKRIWWVLFTIESKTCMKLGRPFSAERSQMTTTLPSDDLEAASLLGGVLGSYGPDVTWLTYAVQCQKLIATTRDIYCSLYDTFGVLLSQRGINSPYKDPNVLEMCAKFLTSRVELLHEWIAGLPEGLCTRRRASGESFSVDRTPLNIADAAPLWLKRQRVFLELLYHTMRINLCRPFIKFAPSSGTYTPIAEKCATDCINHAIAHTHIMHQVLEESDLLNGWHEGFQWQWNAAVTLIGFVLAYPVGPSTPTARKALDKALAIFEILGSNFAVASSAAAVVKDLAAKADVLLIRRFRDSSGTGGPTINEPDTQGLNESQVDAAFNQSADGTNGPSHYSDFMDWTLTVDAFNSFGEFYSDTFDPLAETWGFN